MPLHEKFKAWTIKVDSWFGPRNTGLDGASVNHKGLDFNYSGGGNTDFGSPILATHEGYATVNSGIESSAGRNVIITSPDGNFRTQYMHLSAVEVESGQYVWELDPIGKMGGSASGKEDKWASHLHYDIQEKQGSNWTPINPVGSTTNVYA